MKSLDELYEYSLSLWGLPYVWGAEGPKAYDCSGFVQHLLARAYADPKGDQTAHGLYFHFLKNGVPVKPMRGALAFYGHESRISHVAWCIDQFIMINASGGGSHINSAIQAKAANASVKIQPIRYRPDLVAVLMPHYRFD